MKLFDDAARDGLRPIDAIIGPLRGFDPAVAAALVAALPRIDTRPKTVAAADHAQQEVTDVLAAHGHRGAAFLRVYHGITVAVIRALDEGRLGPRYFFDRLPGKFAERHFDGVRAELGLDSVSDAARYHLWRPSFAFDGMERSDTPLGRKPALAHFMVGMCIHINLDLAVSLAETIRELSVAKDAATLAEIERGHDFVDSILEEEVGRSTELLARELDCPLSKKILESGSVSAASAQTMATIRRWRAETFPSALRLATAESDAARAAVREEVYRAGARRTVRLFNTLPGLVASALGG
jgi:hypothetical protein